MEASRNRQLLDSQSPHPCLIPKNNHRRHYPKHHSMCQATIVLEHRKVAKDPIRRRFGRKVPRLLKEPSRNETVYRTGGMEVDFIGNVTFALIIPLCKHGLPAVKLSDFDIIGILACHLVWKLTDGEGPGIHYLWLGAYLCLLWLTCTSSQLHLRSQYNTFLHLPPSSGHHPDGFHGLTTKIHFHRACRPSVHHHGWRGRRQHRRCAPFL